MGNAQGSNLTREQVAKWNDMVLIKRRLEQEIGTAYEKVYQAEGKYSKSSLEVSQLRTLADTRNMEFNQVAAQNERLQKTISTKDAELAQLRSEAQHSNNDLNDRVYEAEVKYSKSCLQVFQLQKLADTRSMEFKQVVAKNELLQKTVSTLQDHLSQSKLTIEENNRRISAQASAQTGLHKAHSALLPVHKKLTMDLMSANNELSDLQKHNAELVGIIEEHEKKLKNNSSTHRGLHMKVARLSSDLTSANDDLMQERKKCLQFKEQINQFEQKQKSHATTQRSLDNKISQQNDQIEEQDRKLREYEAKYDALLAENKSLTAQYEMLINDANEGDTVNVELVGALYQLYKVKKEELGEAKTRAVSNDEITTREEPKIKRIEKVSEPNRPVVSKPADSFECNICCYEKPTGNRMVFNPCGHGACNSCAYKLHLCHMCREPIQSKIKQF